MQREPAEIEREIELTRTYLADTVDAIAHKVSPKEVAGRTAPRSRTGEGIKTGSVETFSTRRARASSRSSASCGSTASASPPVAWPASSACSSRSASSATAEAPGLTVPIYADRR